MALPQLTLYTRAGCHLCELAEENLRALEFRYDVIDIDHDAQLRARYGDDVPVLTLDGRTLAKGALGRQRLGTLKIVLLRGSASS